MEKILIHLLFQGIVFIGAIYLFGFIISLINRAFYKCVNHNRAVCYATGLIGTPIHELSHAISCIVFGHKINEIKLFQIDEETGVMGYVNHSYNRRNLYQVLGNYVIGVAPILFGSLLLFFSTKALLPETNAEIVKYVNAWVGGGATNGAFSFFFESLGGVAGAFFRELSFTNLSLVFVLLAFCMCLHMNLSGADIKGSLGSVPLWILLLGVVNAVLYFVFPSVYGDYIGATSTIAIYMASILLISVAFSLFYLIVALIVKLILSAIRR